MTYIELIKEELNSDECNITLANRVKRAGGIEALTEEDAKRICRSLKMEIISDERRDYERMRTLFHSIENIQQANAEIGDASYHDLGSLYTYENEEAFSTSSQWAELKSLCNEKTLEYAIFVRDNNIANFIRKQIYG